ncbi:tyrosine-type recombinase/integrase [Streptomyces tendae]|uniref:tyrosine-type recombinase/integrase n=1 Tax=Streptomyces tendae TaxID=1932 RepID=UPI003695418B
MAWVVVDGDFRLHREATAFLEQVRGLGRSVNTERNYASRVALYLTWCDERGLRWSAPGFENLLRFREWLVSVPLPPRGRRDRSVIRFRQDGSANAVLGTMTQFLLFGVGPGWVSEQVAMSLAKPKFLRFLPDGAAGEGGGARVVAERTLKFATTDPGIEYFTPEQVELMIRMARNARDRFLIVLMRASGMRIGETLGMRRADVHFLADSRQLGCHVDGPHVHVHRRRDNANNALAKSRKSRTIPVTADVVGYYRDYQWERETVPEAADSDMVFVNLFRAPLGRAMSYPNAKQLFDRLAKWAQIVARPHMFRHTAATEWIRAGVPRDVVQELLGHEWPGSLKPYLHTTDRERRKAVERVAAGVR